MEQPSTNQTYSPSLVSADQKAKLHEVADLMLEIYETFAEMRYLDPEGIIRGPHDITNMKDTYSKHGLDPAIIYLYSILPYVDETEADAKDFFHGSCFADFRVPDEVERGRDPFYASPQGDFDSENGEYMRPWMTPLSALGNHGTVLLYDARQHRVWAIDQEGWGSTDPGVLSKQQLQGTGHEVEEQLSDWGDDSSTGGYNESENSQTSSDSWSGSEDLTDELDQLRQDQQEQVDFDEGFEVIDDQEQREAEHETRSINTNSFAHIKSRPAGDVLCDINRWYRELKELPGQGEYSNGPWREAKILKSAYIQNGWPDNFDGDAFDINVARAYAAKTAKYGAEEPLRQVQCIEGWQEHNDYTTAKLHQQISDAKTTDETWIARFELWKSDQNIARLAKDLEERKANADKLCPDGQCQRDQDLPLWELEKLRVEKQWSNEALTLNRQSQPETDTKRQKALAAQRRHKQKKASVYAKAYTAALADAERLCPGQTFESATGIKSLGRRPISEDIRMKEVSMKKANDEILRLNEWAAQLPEDAIMARKAVDVEIEQNRKSIERTERELVRSRQWYATHGDTD
ncbi:Hypothetical protein R9X50_00278400 [Acrodontium crateriforme]|uniref:Uncharacterized protein n=1 Tax=Acrodontium crateriforme TaxID=150365 RepID=A0AAQ3M2U0_9PEZI|nr:Hypothetical protein R9X50_00278400 [Acrodontium crateriforme]